MILVLGGTTGGLGVPLHQSLCAFMGDKHRVYPVGRKECDVESEESIAGFMSKIGQTFTAPMGNYASALHIINATGVSISAMIHKADVMDINRTLRVNLVGNILLLKHARELYKQHGGTFTMLSSVTMNGGPPGTAVYSASKSALYALTRVAAKEFAGLNTRINCLELGYFNRGMIEQIPREQLQHLVQEIPLHDLGTVAALAEACKFLIDCDYVNGAVTTVDGGL